METMLCLLLQVSTIDYKSDYFKETAVLCTIGAATVGLILFLYNIMPPRIQTIGVSLIFWLLSILIGLLFSAIAYFKFNDQLTALLTGLAFSAGGPFSFQGWAKKLGKKLDPTKIQIP